MSGKRPMGPRLRLFVFGLWAVQAVGYLLFRLFYTLDPQHAAWSLLFFGAELFCILSSLMFYVIVVRRADPPSVLSGPWPTIDVLICTYNEDVDLLRTTVVAAREMEGAHRTFLCDDGRRPGVAALAAELGVGYLTRPDNRDHKAGNLNAALTQTDGALVLVLDADHVPRRGMLRRLVPLLHDPTVGFVQTPQVYYNIDSYQHVVRGGGRSLWHEAAVFHHQMQPGADRLGAAFFVGTGALLRRTALDQIGGFATGSITEDIHTSMRLHARGWRSVYVDEALGFLLAPDTPIGFAGQRLRWAQGAMQVLRRESPLRVPGLRPFHRLVYLNSLGGYLSAWHHLVFYLAPAILVLSGLSPIAVDARLGLPVFLAHIVFDLVAFKLLVAPHARLFLSEVYKTLTVGVFLRASLTFFRPSGLAFLVTPKGLHSGLPPALVVLPAVLFVLNLTAVGLGLSRLAVADPRFGAMVLATFFAGWFAVASGLALAHAWERRGAHEPFAVPVSVAAGPGIHLRRLHHGVAYAAVDRLCWVGEELRLDLRAIGLRDEVDARVAAVAPDGRGGAVVRLALDSLPAADRDALDHYLFDTAIPALLRGFQDAPPCPPPSLEDAGLTDAPELLHVRMGLV
jgi:cellulose synthase (UDP-forming)